MLPPLCVPKTSFKTSELVGILWITLVCLEKLNFQFLSLGHHPLSVRLMCALRSSTEPFFRPGSSPSRGFLCLSCSAKQMSDVN
jgi:hypothetical protein